MADDEFERALSYSNSAMSLLKRGRVPPYPQFYELFYVYATGVNSALNERINAIYADRGVPKLERVENLYNEFLKAREVDERINAVSEMMSKNIDAVQDAIQNASESADLYSGSLQKATTSLGGKLDTNALRVLTHELLAETRQMQETNKELEKRLETSRDDVTLLQHDLEEVRRESMTDSLTQIYNRKCFDQQMNRRVLEAQDHDTPLCLIMLDIDHFKNFNDKYGHQTGDQVLRLVAMTLSANTKGKDMAARYGGEEFAIILPDIELKDAARLADTIRKTIQSKELLKRSTNEKLGRITASFGVARLTPNDNAMSLIERADRALYAAKRSGRNRTVAEDDKLMLIQSAA